MLVPLRHPPSDQHMHSEWTLPKMACQGSSQSHRRLLRHPHLEARWRRSPSSRRRRSLCRGVDVVEGSQHIPEKRLAAYGHRRRTVITLPYFGAATRCIPGTKLNSYRTPAIRRTGGRKSQNQGAEGAGRDNRLQVPDDLASASQYGCRACMASRRDQENWLKKDRLMIFLLTESDLVLR